MYPLPAPQMPANRKQAPDAPIRPSKSGSYFVTRNAQNQLKQKVIGEATVFASGGNNSAFSVHASGPIPKIYIKQQFGHFEIMI